MTLGRHVLRIVKADPPARRTDRETSFEDERTTGRAGRTTSLAIRASLLRARRRPMFEREACYRGTWHRGTP